jgi:hypothetical protein
MEATKKRERNASNIIKWHYLTKINGNGDPVGLRGYSHHDEGIRYDIQLLDDGRWEVFMCWWSNLTGTPGLDEPHYKTLKTGTVLECMVAAEIHDEKMGITMEEADEDEWERD